MNLTQYFLVLLRGRRTLAALVAVPTLTAVIVVLLIPNKYLATATLAPEATGSIEVPGLIGGLASQLGIRAGGGPNLAYYAELLKSRLVLRRLLTERFPCEQEDTLCDLGGLLLQAPWDHSRTDLVEELERALRSEVFVSEHRDAGLISVAVAMPRPVLAKLVLDSILAETARVNEDTRRTSARARREFLDARVAEAAADLRASEEQLRGFYTTNRVTTSPELRFEEQRLLRVVGLREQLYTTLTGELEAARLDEIRDLPVFSVVEPPVVPARHWRPRRTVTVIATLVASCFFGVFFVFVRAGSGMSPGGQGLTSEGSDLRREMTAALAELARLIPGRGRRTTTPAAAIRPRD